MPSRTPQRDATSEVAASGTIEAQRREPFGKSPSVGARGIATQQRLLAAALELFDEVGYHQTTVETITERAGCSRPTLYQYFESKDDLFRRLAGRFGEDLAGLIESLEPIDASAAGLTVTRRWFGQLLDVHEQYRPIARSFAASLQRDRQMVEGARALSDRYGTALRSVLVEPPPTNVALEAFAGMVMVTAFGTCTLGSHPNGGLGRQRLVDGVASAVHRAFFGKIPDVNAMLPDSALESPPQRELGPPPRNDRALRPKGERTRSLLLTSARAVFAELGYHATRVDDIAAKASLSHGAFYRYFPDKEAIFLEIALAAAAGMVELLDELPEPTDGLESWCRRYYTAYRRHGALFSMWAEANEAGVPTADDIEHIVGAKLETILAGRGFGDAAVDSLFLWALVQNGPQATIGYGALDVADAVAATAQIMDRSILD